MNQHNIISDLVKWIEKNLEQPLSIDHVAKKSGYSKWHLQRMFKDVTGSILGSYIRHRRLTHAALALRLTSKPILDIAMQYRFDSQQTFTRSFKKQFNMTPACYRRAKYWDPQGLTPPIQLDKTPLSLPEPQFITLADKTLWGVSYKNRCNLNEMLDQKILIRTQFFEDYLKKYGKNYAYQPGKVFALNHAKPCKDNPDEQEIIYTIALEENHAVEGVTQHELAGGLYVSFKFIGPISEFKDFISQVYMAALPTLQVRRRDGDDIEIYFNHQPEKHIQLELTQIIECDYCIPIITAHEYQRLFAPQSE